MVEATQLRRERIDLRDVADADDPRCPDGMDGCLVVSYVADMETRNTTVACDVSARLPLSHRRLFDGETCDPAALSPTERRWVTVVSGALGNRIDFDGVEV